MWSQCTYLVWWHVPIKGCSHPWYGMAHSYCSVACGLVACMIWSTRSLGMQASASASASVVSTGQASASALALASARASVAASYASASAATASYVVSTGGQSTDCIKIAVKLRLSTCSPARSCSRWQALPEVAASLRHMCLWLQVVLLLLQLLQPQHRLPVSQPPRQQLLHVLLGPQMLQMLPPWPAPRLLLLPRYACVQLGRGSVANG